MDLTTNIRDMNEHRDGENESEADGLAEDVVGAMSGRPALSDMGDDDTVTVEFNWFKHPRKDSEGFSVEAVWGLDPDAWKDYLYEHVEGRIDRRRLTKGTNTLGTLTIRGDGEIVDHTVHPQYLKPSER